MTPLLLLALLAAYQVKPLTGCTAANNLPCPQSRMGSEFQAKQEEARTFIAGPLQPRYLLTDRQAGQTSEDFRRLAYAALTKGLTKVTVPTDFTTAYELLLVGPDTVPLAVNKNGQVLLAAARFGKGKIVVLGHDRYLFDSSFSQLLQNAVSWLKPTTTSTVGVYSKLSALASLLQGAGETVAISDAWVSTMGVFCMDASSATQADDLVNFIESGGSVLIAGDASAWTGKDVITKAAGNRIASVAGIYFTNQAATLDPTISFTEIPPQYRLFPSLLDNFKDDVAAILSGVTIVEGRWFSKPLVHGSLAFPIIYGRPNYIMIPGAYYGRGKVIALTHPDQERNTVFVTSALKWLRGDRQGRIGLNPSLANLKTVQTIVNGTGLTYVVTNLSTATNIDVYVTEGYNDSEADAIQAFVAKGGGLLFAGETDYWTAKNPTLNIMEYAPANRILNRFGITLVTDWDYGPWSITNAAYQRTIQYDLRKYLAGLAATGQLDIPEAYYTQFIEDCQEILNMKKSSVYQLSQLYITLVRSLTTSKLKPPGPTNLVTNMLEKLFWKVWAYAPASINVVSVNATATVATPWRSTGLYAQPGKAITFIVPKAAVGAPLEIQFGCQSDDLWKPDINYKRHPLMIPYTYPINSEILTFSSKFGGMIYILVRSPASLGNLEFVVENAERAPYFKDGVTEPAEWETSIRANPAPWAEIEAKNIIFTVPSTFVRSLTSATVQNTLQTWNQAMDAVAYLAARSFLNPERLVAETQIAIGDLHSGYPMMTYDVRSPTMVNASLMIEKRAFWGYLQEVGHNLQQSIWDFPYSREVTNNLFPIYVGEQLFGVNRAEAWDDNLVPANRERVTLEYLQSSTRLQDANDDAPVRNLNMYLYLQEGFGWQPFREVFAKYQSMLNQQVDEVGRLNLWVKMFSQEVGRNLMPYFTTLKWPITNEVKEALSTLPVWDKNPLNQLV